MSVLRVKNSKFYQIRFTHNGKLYVRSSKTSVKKTAEALERKMRDDLCRQENLGERERIRLSDAIDLHTKKDISDRYVKHLIGFKSYILDIAGDVYVDSISTAKVFKWTGNKEGKTATKKYFVSMLRAVIGTAHQHGYQTPIGIDYPSFKKEATRIRFLSIEEEDALLRELQPFSERHIYSQQLNYDFVIALLDLGCRFNEAAKLKWDDIDLNEGTIRLYRSKVRNESTLVMTDRLCRVIERRSVDQTSEYVFSNKNGSVKTSEGARGIRNAIKRAGLDDFTIHDLRHSYASRLVQAGLPLQQVSELLGHSDVRTTMIYASLAPGQASQNAVDILNNLNRKPKLSAVG